MNNNVKIVGTGYSVGNEEITNDDLAQKYGMNPKIIEKLFGIKTRRKFDSNMTTSDLAYMAINDLFSKSNYSIEDINHIVYVTCSPDNFFPSSALQLHKKLNLKNNVSVMEMKAQCSGFSYGLITASKYVDENNKYVLLVLSEQILKIVHPDDKISNALFGDGAAALLLTKSDGESKIIDYDLRTDSRFINTLKLDLGTSIKKSITEVTSNDVILKWSSIDAENATDTQAEEWKATHNSFISMTNNILDKNGLKIGDIDHFIIHNGTMSALNKTIESLEIQNKPVYHVFTKYGNISGPQPAIALAEANANNKFKRKDKILILTAGAGAQFGCLLLEW